MSEDEITFYKKIIPACNVIFDVGCRDDEVFIEINPKAEVHYFDPNYKEKMSKHKYYNNYALGSKEETIDFRYRYGSFLHRTDYEKFDGKHDSKRATIRRLDDYCLENGVTFIDFLKIDTEGWDFEVILGAGDFLKNVKYIQFEHFPFYANDKYLEDIFEYLRLWDIYEIGGKPMNYLATKDNFEYLKMVQAKYIGGVGW